MGDVGHDIGVSMPRGLILPPDAPAEAQEWWIATMQQVVETPEWAAYIENNTLTPTVLYGEDFRAFLTRTQDGFGEVLRSVGAIQ
jgi:putative tricarboxylic transport membrane protein